MPPRLPIPSQFSQLLCLLCETSKQQGAAFRLAGLMLLQLPFMRAADLGPRAFVSPFNQVKRPGMKHSTSEGLLLHWGFPSNLRLRRPCLACPTSQDAGL
eukprot:scaffold3383_cov17-Tisochrysis_lutea.AAC.6